MRNTLNRAQILGAQTLHFPYSLPRYWLRKCAPCAPSSFAPDTSLYLGTPYLEPKFETLYFICPGRKKPPKPYRCEICDKNFQSKGKLKEHISSIHDKRKPFACNICPAKFFCQDSINRHISAVHEGNKPF